MPEQWTGDFIRELHLNKVTYDELGAKLNNMSKQQISMILNSSYVPKKVDAQDMLYKALEEVLKDRIRD